MFERFGNIPVSNYSGTAMIAIPLYTINEGDIKIPIIVNYHSSGIKVADEATWVGLGWDLSPGGAITQEVRGKEDALDNNLDYEVFPVAYNLFKGRLGPIASGAHYSALQQGDCLKSPPGPQSDCGGSWTDPANILSGLLDGQGQPDIYSYSFSGFSGKFYINPETKIPVSIEKNDEIFFTKSASGWIATTLGGDKYHFETIETANGQAPSNIVRGITYKLSKVKTYSGDSIQFVYVDEQSSQFYYQESSNMPNQAGWMPGQDGTWGNKKTLTKIVSPEITVDFILEDREDIIPVINTIKRVKSIEISSTFSGKKIKGFNFIYSYFPYNTFASPYKTYGDISTATKLAGFGKRLKLDAIAEVGYADNGTIALTLPSHKFEYDLSVTMPLKNSLAVDFWGYFNGKNNSLLLPDLNYFDYPYDTRYIDQVVFKYNYVGANRYPDNIYSGAYMLKKITYPTGGFTEFEYEPNTFSNQFIPTAQQEAVAHKYVNLLDKNNMNDITSSTFPLSRSATFSFYNRIYDGYTTQGGATATYDQLMGSYIKLTKITKDQNGNITNSELLKQWDLTMALRAQFEVNHGVEWREDIRITYDGTPNVFYKLEVFMPSSITNNSFESIHVTSQLRYYDDTGVDRSVSKQCGMRIKKIRNFTDSVKIASNKEFKYYDGKLLNRFEPLSVIPVASKDPYEGYLSCTGCFPTAVPFFKMISISSEDFSAGGGGIVGYGKVEEIDHGMNEGDSIGKKVYYYVNNENQTRKGYPNRPDLRNGFLTREEVFDKVGNLASEVSYLYSDLLPAASIYAGIIIVNHKFGVCDWCETGSPANPYVPSNGLQYKFSYGIYPIESKYNKVVKKTSRQYALGGQSEIVENYVYNNLGQLVTSQTTDSKGVSILSSFIYPNDVTGSSQADLLKLKKLYSNIISQTTAVNGVEKSKVQWDYAYNNGVSTESVVNTAISSSYHQGLLSKEISFDRYDQRKRLLQLTEKGIVKSFFWGYGGSQIVAIVTGVDYATAAQYVSQAQIDAACTNEQSLRDLIDQLRSNLPQAEVETFTYKPAVGLTSKTDVSGQTIYYEYDVLGKLKLIRDQDNNILQRFSYHFKEEN